MIEYKYKKRENKFTENGHTMFETDVLQRLKRLADLEEQIKQKKLLPIQRISKSNFKTVIALYDDIDSRLVESEQILPVHKGDKLTIEGEFYEVDYVDYDFDKGIFEVVVICDS